MRLTLRTLLAWLDDTLQPAQVREIGIQVAESPLARELTERIHRVSRQRRLSVPSSSGPEGADPNVVASYLDNDLDADEVADYEKKCLTSDVKLAEVASVHQILSLLGQKVKVPPEARVRMYQLVKGRETVRSRQTKNKRSQSREPVTSPIVPWNVPDLPRRPWIERIGLIAGMVFLVGLSVVTASWSLRIPDIEGAPPAANSGAALTKELSPAAAPLATDGKMAGMVSDPDELEVIPAGGVQGGQPRKAAVAAEETAAKEAGPSEATTTKSVESVASVPEPAAPATPAMATAPDGILVRYNNDQREWDRLVEATPVGRSDRLLCLSPFRATITFGKIPVILVGETEVRILSQPTDKVPAIELIHGRLLLRNTPAGSLKVGFGDKSLTLDVAPSNIVIIERLVQREHGVSVGSAPPVVVYCVQGETTLSSENKQEMLTASDAITIENAGALKRSQRDAPPAWATETEPSPEELQRRERFARMFHPGRPVLTEIVAASEDDDAEIKKLSILALKSLGDISLLMPMLSRKGDAVTRQSALAAVRSYMGLSREAAARVREQLAEEFGDDTSSFVEKMLVGYSAADASNPQLFERLVAALGPEQESVGVRELALDTLKQLTGHDGDLGYDVDNPEGKGLKAWKDLLREGKLRYTPARPQ